MSKKQKIEFSFDKFVKDIEQKEKASKVRQREYIEAQKDSPSRRYNELYNERWQNRIRWTVKK